MANIIDASGMQLILQAIQKKIASQSIPQNPTNLDINADLNNYTLEKCGFYYGAGSNSITNKPHGVDAFGMLVLRIANGYCTQLLCSVNQLFWYRVYGRGVQWHEWKRLLNTSDDIMTITEAQNLAKTYLS